MTHPITVKRLARCVLICVALLGLRVGFAADAPEPIDPVRGRQLMQKSQSGQPLTDEEKAYLDRVKQEIQRRQSQAKGTPMPTKRPPTARVDTSALVALTDLKGEYHGETGGLYGGGINDLPEAHQAAYVRESAKVQPLDAEGRPEDGGKIGLITIGFSNTSLESAVFKDAADADALKSPRVVVVNGAIGSRSAVMWAWDGADLLPAAERERLDQEMDLLHMPKENRKGSQAGGGKDTWPTLDARIQAAGLSAKQVQVVWLKQVEAQPRPLGDFPKHARALELDMTSILRIAKQRFPNLRVAYLSSRTYGGWAGPNSGSPEPFAYESAFGVRWLIQNQISGGKELNFDAARGKVEAPLVLWGPYLWANGSSGRTFDGMTWGETDVREDDHMHPSAAGCRKVADLLLQMFHTDAAAKRWYVAPASQGSFPTVPAGQAVRFSGAKH